MMNLSLAANKSSMVMVKHEISFKETFLAVVDIFRNIFFFPYLESNILCHYLIGSDLQYNYIDK